MLDELLCSIWQDENVPKEWMERLTDKIPKKGNLSAFDNCRGIISLQGKILKRGMSQWLKAAVDTELQTTKVGSDEIDDVLTKQQVVL